MDGHRAVLRESNPRSRQRNSPRQDPASRPFEGQFEYQAQSDEAAELEIGLIRNRQSVLPLASIANWTQFWSVAGTVFKNRSLSAFIACCLTILLIGWLDTWLVVRYSDSILDMEKNPVCLYLIEMDSTNLSVFIYGKMLGIGTVLCTLTTLYTFWHQVAMLVTYGVTLFQVGLLGYLYVFSDISFFCHCYLR